ncbi:unnamed protein product [Rotaria magnacalcarata]|uniref:Agmatine deiminase n=1 Tax=Rotaria magnacalcarata TaxID=392030 RepID=A0A819BC04_9BILA|nr:unnamed protein product [Rotaria magnacalcarata]
MEQLCHLLKPLVNAYVILLSWFLAILNLYLFDKPLREYATSVNLNTQPTVLDTIHYYTAEEGYQVLSNLGDHGRDAYRLANYADFTLPIFLFLSLSLPSLALGKGCLHVMGPLLYMISDYIENIAEKYVLEIYPKRNDIVMTLACYTGLVKILTFLGSLFVLIKSILIDLAIILAMASVDATYPQSEETIRSIHGSGEKTLIVLAAPSVNNSYYRAIFNQIIDYMANFANLVHGKDEIVILADAATLPFFNGKVNENVLIEADIEDIWIRDFSPVIPSQQIKFRYLPSYLSESVANAIDKSFEKWLSENNLNYKTKSSIILDGGNVVDNPDGSRVIITDRILKDNPQLTKAEAKEQIKDLMNLREVAIIPEVPDDTTGHSDGMLMWVNNDKILLPQASEPERTQVIDELERSFPDVDIVEIPDYYKYASWKGFTSACNIFINAVVTDHYIYMPTFDGPHDESMFKLIQSHTTKTVVAVPAEKVCFMGGSVRCLSWQVKGELKNQILQLTGRD